MAKAKMMEYDAVAEHEGATLREIKRGIVRVSIGTQYIEVGTSDRDEIVIRCGGPYTKQLAIMPETGNQVRVGLVAPPGSNAPASQRR